MDLTPEHIQRTLNERLHQLSWFQVESRVEDDNETVLAVNFHRKAESGLHGIMLVTPRNILIQILVPNRLIRPRDTCRERSLFILMKLLTVAHP